jgi:N-acetylmuramoyl-L-alanine amidase
MSKRFLTAASSVATLCATSLVLAYAPTDGAVAAEPLNISPSHLSTVQTVSTLLPTSVVEEAMAETETPAYPLPDFPTQSTRDDKNTSQARSLAELVMRYGATATPNREMECLAVTVYFESKGEPLEGQLAVAETVINRSKSGRFPSTLCGVLFQPSQFSFVRGGGYPAIARSSANWKNAVAIAHIAKNDLWSSRASNALFFHARYVSPGWKLRRVASVGNHIFYR